MSKSKSSSEVRQPVQTLQVIIWSVLLLNIVAVLYIWLDTSIDLLLSGTDGFWIALGRILGMLAAFSALIQFMLMARAHWIEKAFGLENLAKIHRLNGYAVIILILLHPLALTIGYAAGSSWTAQYVTFLQQYEKVGLAFISTLLFLLVAVSSIYIVRKRLKFENWYYVHLVVYAAIILAFGHQIAVGGSFAVEPLYQYYWIGLYVFVGINVLVWRFGIASYNFFKYQFSVDRIVKETDDTSSIYISGRNLGRWRSLPGQYVLVRFLSKELGLQEHPFSLSFVPKNNTIRLTIKAVGDYTQLIPHVKTGTKVVVSGPYGVFTDNNSTNSKRLYIAGGVGITPLRTMLEAADSSIDSVLIYGNKTKKDVIFDAELKQIAETSQLTIHTVLSNQPDYNGLIGRIDIPLIQRLVPDYKDRDVYICGPPVMMDAVVTGLRLAGVDERQIHFERFSFLSK